MVSYERHDHVYFKLQDYGCIRLIATFLRDARHLSINSRVDCYHTSFADNRVCPSDAHMYTILILCTHTGYFRSWPKMTATCTTDCGLLQTNHCYNQPFSTFLYTCALAAAVRTHVGGVHERAVKRSPLYLCHRRLF